MKLWLERFAYGYDTTAGRLYDRTEEPPRFLCWTLEDEKREVKVYGETCIPEGVYELVPRTDGGMAQRYRDKFGPEHRMLYVQPDPEGFELVMVHIGNWAYEGDEAPDGITKDDTLGCPLVGETLIMTDRGEFELRASTPAYKALNAKVEAAWKRGEQVILTIGGR